MFCTYCGTLIRKAEEAVNDHCLTCWNQKNRCSKTEEKELVAKATNHFILRIMEENAKKQEADAKSRRPQSKEDQMMTDAMLGKGGHELINPRSGRVSCRTRND